MSSASVYGIAPKTIDVTEFGASEMLIPMFPVSTPCQKSRYCCHSGTLRPNDWANDL